MPQRLGLFRARKFETFCTMGTGVQSSSKAENNELKVN
jgi:hypothetical protein